MENKNPWNQIDERIMSQHPRTPPVPCKRVRYFGSRQDIRCATRPVVSEGLWGLVSDKLFGKVTTVWDAFCGIGVDTIQATRYFQRVFATEIEQKTYEKFVTNMRMRRVSGMVLSSCQIDCLEVKELPFPVNLLYFDPPWGKDYPQQKAEKGQFQFAKALLGDQSTTIGEAYEKLVNFALPKYTLVKIPTNAAHEGPWLHGKCEDHDDDLAVAMRCGCIRLFDQWAADGVVWYLTKQ